jgi:diacylglycerol kinase
MKNEEFSLRKRLISFRYAFRGIGRFFRHEHNARIHAVAGTIAATAGFFFRISSAEWGLLILSAGMVFAAETFNSSIEKLSDVVSPGYSKAIRDIKDLSAGAVLFTAIAAVLVGFIIFLPKMMDYFIP